MINARALILTIAVITLATAALTVPNQLKQQAVTNAVSNATPSPTSQLSPEDEQRLAALEQIVIPESGIELPIVWGGLGQQLVNLGVIDTQKLADLYENRGGIPTDMQTLLNSVQEKPIQMNRDNANTLLNLFWALGLANYHPLLVNGPMQDPKYEGAGNFASTGGWSLSKGAAMDHYSRYRLIQLTKDEEEKVTQIAQTVYRPCCGNSTWFPDCNHGMAMLALIELMVASGADVDTIYRVALQANAYWFPDTYLTVAQFYQEKGIAWADVNPQEILEKDVSSAQGFQQIASQVKNPVKRRGASCSV